MGRANKTIALEPNPAACNNSIGNYSDKIVNIIVVVEYVIFLRSGCS